ncbi:MOSC domain-containing protein [methanotrophic endosymbiont of Bathymodiolus puteoserpentis (Logatchev)]|jgi:MOSC domain-containing protein YiiM|uniref:MOSC domain-containing protein n=1 Tax=methanotrophic endosymbiont of Bathymodiolus puteoserpentis (Logatchev) TaxID=343235 RepID=UPI0013CD486B|nr:MOSC domain-containing protein [methanotrophic endosymbiont of Bathymodiolus puteoserpentis (Logatchev)]SHE22965.1 Uncharacterized protein conserved in bacteria [methanotrophic endosymbiont of Bathymodiolus puteoserpentis (Logatchev)]
MNLLSVNISKATEVEYQGKIISTGIFKKPITTPLLISKENLQGDQQVDLKNHGGEHKAIYAFSSDHYPYWSNVLKNTQLTAGIFGENLTISGFDESSLCIGDHISIGQCVLEVSQPRIPCFKLGIALQNKDMPRLFIEHFATGIYLRVLQEGLIETGNKVEVIKKGKLKLSVQSVFRAYFDKAYLESIPVMEKALQVPELAPEWRKKLALRLSSKKIL